METRDQIPWKGPQPYDEPDWEIFFGRDAEVDSLQRKLATQRLTVLLGASGSGKTSFIRAGLVPLLRNRRYHPRSPTDEGPVLVLRGWGATASDTTESLMREQLAEALKAIHRWHERYSDKTSRAAEDAKQLEAALNAPADNILLTIEALARAAEQLPPSGRSASSAHRPSLIIIFDQLEELLRAKDRRSEGEIGRFGTQVLGLISDLFLRDNPIRILISMREEFLHALRPLDRTIARLPDMTVLLEPLRPSDAKDVIAQVSATPGVIRIDEEVAKDILPQSATVGEDKADLLRLQAVLYALSNQARHDRAAVVDHAVYAAYLARHHLAKSGAEDQVFQKAIEEWIDSAVDGKADPSDGSQSGSADLTKEVANKFGLAGDPLTAQVRRVTVRVAPHLSSADYKVPQELTNLFRRSLGQVIEVLAPGKPDLLEKVKIDAAAPMMLDWGGAEYVPQSEEGQIDVTSGFARLEKWSPSRTGDAIAASYLLTIRRMEDRNILRRTYNARNEPVCELVHDQMGPMLVRWAEARRGSWSDCASSLAALSGGPPITVDGDQIKDERFTALTWRGCTVQPRGKTLTFDSVVFDRCELRGIVFDSCVFRDVVFDGCVLAGAIFRNCVFEPGSKTSRSVRIVNGGEGCLNCLLFLKCTISDVEFQRSVVRQPSIIASKMLGDMTFEKCDVIQLYASGLAGSGSGKIRIASSSRSFCCSADHKSFSRLEVNPDAHFPDGAGRTVEEPSSLGSGTT